jgi:hypothetical protein
MFLLLITLFSFATPAHAADFSIHPFHPDNQGLAPWCGASTAKMVLDSRGINKDTCEVVSAVTKLDCCSFFTPSGCMVGVKPRQALDLHGVSYKYVTVASSQQAGASLKAVEDVVRAVRNNRMPILHLSNAQEGGPAHAVVVKGVRDVEQLKTLKFVLYDPAAGEQVVPVGYMTNGYYNPSGTRYWWSGSYLAK